MALVPLQLPPGIERNNTPYDTPNRWWDMNGVRWQSGTMQPIGGWTRVTGTPLDTPGRAIHVWRDNLANRRILIGTDAKLYADNSGFVDVTPAGFTPLTSIGVAGGYGTGPYGKEAYGTSRSAPSPVHSSFPYWSFGQWGQDIIFTASSDGHLYYFTQATPPSAATLIATAPSGVAAVLVTAARHVMAIGLSTDQRSVGWSSREDYTDWDFASVTNTAGTLPLMSKTPLLYAVNVKEGVLVFSYTDVFLLEYLGDPLIYGGQDPIGETRMFNPNCVATFGAGNAVWLSGLGFQIYGGGFVQTLPCPILNDVLQGMDPLYGPFRAHASKNGVFPEVWFFYPSVGQTECDRYVAWNYEDNTWTWGALPRTAMAGADAYKLPYMAAADGNVYQHEDGWLAAGVSRIGTIFAETGALGNGQQTMSLSQLLLATGQGFGSVTVEVFGRFAPEGTEYTFGPFVPRSDGYTDARCEARDLRLRIVNAKDGPFGIGLIKGDIVPGSGR